MMGKTGINNRQVGHCQISNVSPVLATLIHRHAREIASGIQALHGVLVASAKRTPENGAALIDRKVAIPSKEPPEETPGGQFTSFRQGMQFVGARQTAIDGPKILRPKGIHKPHISDIWGLQHSQPAEKLVCFP